MNVDYGLEISKVQRGQGAVRTQGRKETKCVTSK